VVTVGGCRVGGHSAEERLDDFLDRSLQVRNVINHQQTLLHMPGLGWLIRFMTTQETLIIMVAGALAAAINILILINTAEKNGNDYYYMPKETYLHIKKLGPAHLSLAVLLVINYILGSALVTVHRGWKTKEMIEVRCAKLSYCSSM
jgi:hypothetical protein